MHESRKRFSWLILVVGAIVTMIASLSVHAVMLQVLHVPYPYDFPRTGWARLPDGVLSVCGAIYLSTQLPQSVRERSFALRCMLMFLFMSTIHEAFFRGPFMEFINLSNFTLYPFLDNIPKLIPFVVISVGVESWSRRTASTGVKLLAAVLLAAVAGLLIRPLADHAFVGVIKFTEAREGHQRYGLPYDWHILLPAYLTFFEPVVSAFAIAFAIRRKLPPAALTRFGITAALIVALKGPVFAPLINIHYANGGPLKAILSYAQFSFETITLAILAAMTVHFYFSLRKSSSARGPVSFH
jgi:hypothetical protein